MKRKLLVCGVLVVICLSVFVLQGVSQPTPPTGPAPSPPHLAGTATPARDPLIASNGPKPSADFSTVQPQQEWSFEQLVEALKGVRARQKELKTQEADLLAKMADKIEQKRKDLQKAEEVLQDLQGERSREKPAVEEKKPIIRG